MPRDFEKEYLNISSKKYKDIALRFFIGCLYKLNSLGVLGAILSFVALPNRKLSLPSLYRKKRIFLNLKSRQIILFFLK